MSEEKKNKIEIDQSSLLSLKNELLRKKAEALANQSISTNTKTSDGHKKKIPIESVKSEKDHKVIEHEECNNEKVKKVLEAKAKYYDKMEKSGQNTSLILFKNKIPVKDPIKITDEDYIEFTDCFGRTRSVTREEYDAFKRQQEKEDGEYDSIEEVKKPIEEEEIGESFMRQREEWRRQEQINSEQNEIFYQDLLFNEAREHGTGFYAFSTDHAERQEQQEKFKKMREDTEKAQSERNLLKKQRDNLIKNRVSQAKARLRQKLGLPPEAETSETNEEQNNESTQDVPESSIVNEKEAERERERKNYIRPWDREKLAEKRRSSNDDEEWTPKREKFIMTQEEWVEQEREKRNQGFAPFYDSKASSSRDPVKNDVEKDIIANLKYIRKKFD